MKKKISLNTILNDKVHGSSEILKRYLDYLYENRKDSTKLKSALLLARKKFPHFPAILEIIDNMEILLRENNTLMVPVLISFFKMIEAEAYKMIFKNAETQLQKHNTILTISHSRTLIEIFRLLRKTNPKLKIFVCESRPLNEGKLLAVELKKNKIKNQIITEASAGKIIKQIDAVLLGADQIFKNGSVVNKTGSRMLAILAKYERIPVYVLASKSKFITEQKNKLPEEFEIVEAKIITKIFSN
ncbi:MAG: hypothetical protein RBR74_03915 [Ignavibacteriaceae bacterium]|jgi:translation initiation factor 2B subunit (eIF-2B alpha/beta/delta family)|nr:hypothetical protein [Ignavibacteriaceae bacterium]